jgi:formyl-CoA transferase
MPAPLEGIRIVEHGTFISAPFTGMLLADLGAEVVKIERPQGGDPFRAFEGKLYSPQFIAFNRNKKSVTVDLSKPQGRKLAEELSAKSDVVLDNFRPGTAAKLGIGPEVLRKANPRLICCSINGFGPDGPYRDRPSYDTVALSLSGYLSLYADAQAPQIRGPAVADAVSGLYAAVAIQGALIRRERTGEGTTIDVPMMEAMIAFAGDAFAAYFRKGAIQEPTTRAAGSQSYAFRCADGKALGIHLSSPTKFWDGLLAALERQELASDPRFSSRELRVRNYQELAGELGKTFANRPRHAWFERLEKADVPFAPIYNTGEVSSDPQVKHLGTFKKLQHPTQGEIVMPAAPFFFDGTRSESFQAPPELGEHTAPVLRWLGRSEQDIQQLRRDGVV